MRYRVEAKPNGGIVTITDAETERTAFLRGEEAALFLDDLNWDDIEEFDSACAEYIATTR